VRVVFADCSPVSSRKGPKWRKWVLHLLTWKSELRRMSDQLQSLAAGHQDYAHIVENISKYISRQCLYKTEAQNSSVRDQLGALDHVAGNDHCLTFGNRLVD
jgi:hypothetical protein